MQVVPRSMMKAQRAEVTDSVSADAWVQWRLEIDLEPGRHGLEVRAIDVRAPVPKAGRGRVDQRGVQLAQRLVTSLSEFFVAVSHCGTPQAGHPFEVLFTLVVPQVDALGSLMHRGTLLCMQLQIRGGV